MRKITKYNKIIGVPNAWRKQYPKGCEESSEKIYKQLVALKVPTEDKIKSIIGNDSWTRLECDECHQDSDIVIRLGQEPDYDSATVHVCMKCLRKAARL